MRKFELVLWLLVIFLSGMVTEAAWDLHTIHQAKPKPVVIQKFRPFTEREKYFKTQPM